MNINNYDSKANDIITESFTGEITSTKRRLEAPFRHSTFAEAFFLGRLSIEKELYPNKEGRENAVTILIIQ